jgi:hypothetical protein
MFTPPAARRTDPRRLHRDHRPVVDAVIAAQYRFGVVGCDDHRLVVVHYEASQYASGF